MKKRVTHLALVTGYFCISLCLLASAVCAEWSLTDDFGDGLFNCSIWYANASVNNSVTEEGGSMVLNARPYSFAHVEMNNSWDYLTVQANFKVSDVNSGSGLFAPGLFFFWGPGNWSSLQLDASKRKVMSYTSLNGEIISNKSSYLNISYGEFYNLVIEFSSRDQNRISKYVTPNGSFYVYYPDNTYGVNYPDFSGPPKKIILGKFEAYNNSIEGGNFSTTYIDDFGVRFGPEWDSDTAKYLIGKVHVAVLFVSQNNIPYPEDVKASVKYKADLAARFLRGMAPHQANLTFSFSYHNASLINGSVLVCRNYECGDPTPPWCSTWMSDVIRSLNYSGRNLSSFEDFAAYVRDENGADQSVVLYSVYSPAYYETCKADNYASYGNYYVIPEFSGETSLVYDSVYPHEFLHTFGANDEYDSELCSSCIYPSSTFGYANGNCIICNDTVPCVMGSLQGYKYMCAYTRGQIGWGDHDGDGILDPLDPQMYVASQTTSSTTTTTTTTLPCYSDPSRNLTEGINEVVFETPHGYPANSDCYSSTYTCPEGYYGSVYAYYDTEAVWDRLYVYNEYTGSYSRYSGNSSSYVWIPVPNQKTNSSEYVNRTQIRIRFISDNLFESWGVRVDKINCSADNPGISHVCSLAGDYPPCLQISIGEIVNAIRKWTEGSYSLYEVELLITVWVVT
jgi:hypothetical protein